MAGINRKKEDLNDHASHRVNDADFADDRG
jgi:hypothetical protein